MKSRKTVSAAVQQRNQDNSKKSTGPKTQQGKNRSRFNALKHGLTAKRLMLAADGKPIDNGITEIVEALRARYGADDVVAQLIIDNIAVDYWRQNKGLEAEMSYLSRKDWPLLSALPTILRYNTTNRRALLKNLELLEKLQDTAEASAGGTTTDEYEEGDECRNRQNPPEGEESCRDDKSITEDLETTPTNIQS